MPQAKNFFFLFAALLLTLSSLRAVANDGDVEGYAASQIGEVPPLKPAAIAITNSNESLAEKQNAADKSGDPNNLYVAGSSTMICDPNCAECMRKAICADVGRGDTVIQVNLSSDASTGNSSSPVRTSDQQKTH